MIAEAELDRFVAALPLCSFPGCSRPGAGPNATCCGAHANGVLTRGRPRRGEVRARISIGRRRWLETPEGKAWKDSNGERTRRWYGTAEGRAFLKRWCAPEQRFNRELAAWAVRNPAAAKRAADRLIAALRRSRGGAPRKTQLHARWSAMFAGRDAELEELLASDGLSRLRAIAWLDWQRHPQDWPRDKWPASRSDPDDIDPVMIGGASNRVKKALQRGGTKPLVP